MGGCGMSLAIWIIAVICALDGSYGWALVFALIACGCEA
jgi:hypothetical protein